VTDDLQALVAAELDVLQQEEAAFGPLVDDRPSASPETAQVPTSLSELARSG
jgi:hypothetical protein